MMCGKILRPLLLTIAFVLGGTSAVSASDIPAVPRTGADLRDLAQECVGDILATTDNPERFRYCYGYQAGVLTGAVAYTRLFKTPSPFCLGDSETDGELNLRIVDFITRNPKALEWDAALVTLAAVIQAYPCQQRPKQ